MLRFFKREPAPISIFVDKLAAPDVTSSDSRLVAFHDKKDACMQRAISTVKLLVDESHNKLHAIFALPDTTDVKLSIIPKSEVVIDAKEIDFVLAKCAAESVLRKLFAKKLLESEVVAFTATRGTSKTDTYNIYTSQLLMNPSTVTAKSIQNDTISCVYAELHARELHFVFNALTPILRKEIESVLASVATIDLASDERLGYRK